MTPATPAPTPTPSPITVIVSTSPRPSHPSVAITARAIASVRESIPGCHVIVTCDGTDGSLPPAYRQACAALQPLADAINVFGSHVHQSGMLGWALRKTDTPFLLYLEDDWLVSADVPWAAFCALIARGEFHSIKLHANHRISPYYEHLMVDRVMYQDGVRSDRHTDQRSMPVHPFVRTRQWSQNPHLASTQFYRDKILPLVDGRCDYVENLVHGVIANSPWEEYRTAIYNPASGDMFRITHLDGKNTVFSQKSEAQ